MFEVFGDFDPAEHEAEAEARWGETEAYKESARRTRRYTKDDWKRFKAESDAVNEAIAALMDEGVAADDPRAMDAVERHRLLIDTWFYPCPHEMHVQLGRHVRGGPAVRRELREDPARDGAVRVRRDRGQRRAGVGRLSIARPAAAAAAARSRATAAPAPAA